MGVDVDLGVGSYPEDMVYMNIFGESFIEAGGFVFKVSPESGAREEVCRFDQFNADALGDYWTGESLKKEWETVNGLVPNGSLLVPMTPFVLGGLLEVENLMVIPASEAISFYKKIRDAIKYLHDGDTVQIVVKD